MPTTSSAGLTPAEHHAIRAIADEATQVSKASERSWRIVDRLILVSLCLYILGIAGGLL